MNASLSRVADESQVQDLPEIATAGCGIPHAGRRHEEPESKSKPSSVSHEPTMITLTPLVFVVADT
jgi:hypothetical protein